MKQKAKDINRSTRTHTHLYTPIHIHKIKAEKLMQKKNVE